MLAVLLLHVAVSVAGSYLGAEPAPDAAPVSTAAKIGIAIDVWIMPVMLLLVIYAVGRYLGGRATLTNVLWVLVWCQLPVIALSVVTIVMQKFGVDATAPVLHNKVSFEGGLMVLDPPTPMINASAMVYFVVSTIPLLWSFQILLSGLAAIERVTVKQAMWILTLAMIALIVLRLPVTLALGDRDVLDVFGLNGIVELQDAK